MFKNAMRAVLTALFFMSLSTTAFSTYDSYALRVNCGGAEYDTVHFGDHYIDNQGGSTYVHGGEIYGTDDDYLYMTHRHSFVTYGIPVPNGLYKVKLQFAEMQAIRVGQRNLSAYIEGTRVISNLDVYGAVGPNTALDYEFTVQVNDGVLNIDVNRGNISWLYYPAMLNAFSITSTKPQSTGPVKVSGRGITVNGGGFQIKGVSYQPIPIGYDVNGYDIFNDAGIYNRDFTILREMNCNTIRTWKKVTSSAFLDAAYNGGTDPIYVVMGFPIDESLDFAYAADRQSVINEFTQYVNTYKNHPAVLMWSLGNQHNYSYSGDPADWYTLVNELAWTAYEAEGATYHPVTLINGDIWDTSGPIGDPLFKTNDASLTYLDVWGANIYSGASFQGRLQYYTGRSTKPFWVSEYGVPGTNQRVQAEGTYALLAEIGSSYSVCSGGTVMEYSDELWRSGDPSRQDDYGDGAEFFGVVAVEDNGTNPDILHPKPAYYILQEKWETDIIWKKNLALNKNTYASSYEGYPTSGNLQPLKATDGKPYTRWASQWYDPQWIYVDLGSVCDIGQVVLRWEAAYALEYEIQVSDNATNWTTAWSTSTGDGGTDFIYFDGNPVSGRYVRMYGTQRGIPCGYSIWDFEVYEPVEDNLALNKTATASSVEPWGDHGPEKALDGSPWTRWASEDSDPQWIYADLGSTCDIYKVVLQWEAAYASSYQIQVSDNATNWTTVYSTSSGDGAYDYITFSSPVSARYVRMYGTQRGTPWGYSLWELQVYGDDGTPPVSDNLALNKAGTASSVEPWGDYGPEKAFDGDLGTRWASEDSDPQWIYVDLGSVCDIGQVVLKWEAAYAKTYQIQMSDDAINWATVWSTSGGDGSIDVINFSPSLLARYVRMYGTQRGTPWGYSLWEFEVYPGEGGVPAEPLDKALNKPATASSVEPWGDYGPEKAFDGDPWTRWASEDSDPQWIYVDLGSTRDIRQVVLRWEAAYASSYQVQVSDNGTNWTTIWSTVYGAGGTDTINFNPSRSGRYVRIYGTERGTPWGYSLWDFEVYE